jgi:hypothetical protein
MKIAETLGVALARDIVRELSSLLPAKSPSLCSVPDAELVGDLLSARFSTAESVER